MHSLEGVGSGSSLPNRKEALSWRTALPIAIDLSFLLRVTREFTDRFLHRLPHAPLFILPACRYFRVKNHAVQSSTISPFTRENPLVFAVTRTRFLANA